MSATEKKLRAKIRLQKQMIRELEIIANHQAKRLREAGLIPAPTATQEETK